MSTEDQSKQSIRYHGCPEMAYTTILPGPSQNGDKNCPHPQEYQQFAYAEPTALGIRNCHADTISSMSDIRQMLITNSDLNPQTTDIIMASWRQQSKCKYNTLIQTMNFIRVSLSSIKKVVPYFSIWALLHG